MLQEFGKVIKTQSQAVHLHKSSLHELLATYHPSTNFDKYASYKFINYYQPMHYIAIKITQITFLYVIIRAHTCFDLPGSSSGSSECPY